MKLSILLGMIGPWQVVLILAIVVVLFGGRKIPELMRGIGQGMKEFKKATGNNEDAENDKADEKTNKTDDTKS